MKRRLSVIEILVYGVLGTLFVAAMVFLLTMDEPIEETINFQHNQTVQIVEPYTLKIGVLVNQSEEVTLSRWRDTAIYLEQVIIDHEFEIIPLLFDEVKASVENDEVDFLLVNPSIYVDLEVNNGISRIATLKNQYSGEATTLLGSVIFTTDDHPTIGSINDIVGGSLGAVDEQSLGGYQLSLLEFRDYNIDATKDFEDITFVNNHESVVTGVLEGTFDVGIVRTGILEQMVDRGDLSLNDIQVLSENTNDYPFMTSTVLLPEWPFAKTAHISDELSERISIALIQIEESDDAAMSAGIAGWVIPENYQDVHILLRALKIAPYESYGEISSLESIYQNRELFILIVIILMGLTTIAAWLIHTHSQMSAVSKKAQKMELLAHQANEAKGEFLATMSHEIRTPVSAIIGLLDLLEDTNLTMRQENYYNKLRSSAVNLLGILNNVLDYSKIESQKMDIEKARFNLITVLQNLASVVSVKSEDKKVEFLLDIEPNLPKEYIGDSLRISQVLLNIVSNAMKFTNEGQVVLTVKSQKTTDIQYLLFIIRDSGVGLTPEQIENILQPFIQADKSVSRKYGGTGLGLSISNELIELMGGKLHISSVQGKGSTFSFALPLDIAEKKSPMRVPDLSEYNVMIIDDNTESLRILNRMCIDIGLNTNPCFSSLEAYQLLLEGIYKPDIIVIDQVMPNLTGTDFIEKARKEKLLLNTKGVIMVSSYGKEDIINKVMSLGVYEFLDKPIFEETLYETIFNLLKIDNAVNYNNQDSKSIQFDIPKGTSIILAEDNPINQGIAKELLTREGFDVHVANHGLEVLEFLEEDDYDYKLILMDIQMPQLDGRKATASIRKNPGKYKDIPIIAMSAHALEIEKRKSISAGMNDYVTKPFEIKSLLETISKYIDIQKQIEVLPEIEDDIDSRDFLDEKKGISNLLGDEELYRETLMNFYEDYKNYDSYILSLKEENFNDFVDEMITIQDLSETIGAYHVYDMATVVNLAIKDNRLDGYLLQDFIESLRELNSYLEILSLNQKRNR